MCVGMGKTCLKIKKCMGVCVCVGGGRHSVLALGNVCVIVVVCGMWVCVTMCMHVGLVCGVTVFLCVSV